MTDKLKPCPFCGGDNLSFKYDFVLPDEEYDAWITCYDCNASGSTSEGSDTVEEAETEAIKLWNQRENNDGKNSDCSSKQCS
ncbi:Lar family restriction alleviation protein, partial [Xenorhabdus sp. Flor]|uniref:Lar family restriction alleviation protein n=1 Tax=Xenorhabdus cabanillasii TaxID=351673 RepID=UPI0019A0C2F4